MNLRVNLILDTERRSGSAVSLRFVLTTVGAAIPAMMLLIILSAFVHAQSLHREAQRLEQGLTRSRPQFESAVNMRKDVVSYQAMLSMIDGWRKSRIEWSRQLAALQESVSPGVQLIQLRLEESSETTNGMPARAFVLSMRGRTGGHQAENNVQQFQQELRTNAVLSKYLSTVDIPPGTFVQDTAPRAAKTDRLFEIRCGYALRVMP